MTDSNDESVVAITSDEEGDSYCDQPIIKLFKRLIENDSKQNTVLTNNQILDLLKLEFDIDILKLHSLEVDIYITLMKRFLKDWPQWEEFDSTVIEAKKRNDASLIAKMLQEKHDDLKAYLQGVIDVAKPLARDAAIEAKTQLKNKGTSNEDSREVESSVVLEVDATRAQLNSLFLRRPCENSVFNVDRELKLKISTELQNLKPEVLLNWWNMNIELRIKTSRSQTLLYKREMVHEFKHTLVNKALPLPSRALTEYDQDLNVKPSKKSQEIESVRLIDLIDKIATKCPVGSSEVFKVLEFIKKDLYLMPSKVYTCAIYKRYLSRHSYIRHLGVDDDSRSVKSEKYDLHLEEAVAPMVKVYIGGFDVVDPMIDRSSLSVECTSCSQGFSGPEIMTDLRNHFDKHALEPAFRCAKCDVQFTMVTLAGMWWCHKCS